MDIQNLKDRNIENEFTFSASRSSGPGGQNVNKVNTRVEIRFNVRNSAILTKDEKEIITTRLVKRITSEGELLIISQSERTQLKNREKAAGKMLSLLAHALTLNAPRVPTSPTNVSKTERLEEKRKRGHLKTLRKSPDDDSG